MAIQTTPLLWPWEHVRGHQDNANDVLTVMEQWNVDMDAAAKEHWAQYHTQRHGAPLRFHGEGWRIFLGPKKISTNLKDHLLGHTAGKVAKTYWARKTRF